MTRDDGSRATLGFLADAERALEECEFEMRMAGRWDVWTKLVRARLSSASVMLYVQIEREGLTALNRLRVDEFRREFEAFVPAVPA